MNDASYSGGAFRVLYIEGFSPGPGLPAPLLSQAGVEWHEGRMPYSLVDVLKNPYLVLLFASIAACTWALSVFSGTLTIFAVIGLLLALVLWCVILKRAIVGYVLDECVAVYARRIQELRPDVVFGYSWGGGILCALLNRSLWDGPSILLAPAGEQMWKHAGRVPPTLRRGAIPSTASVLTVQGDRDPIVPLEEVQRLHKGAEDSSTSAAGPQVELLVVARGDHFLRGTVTPHSLLAWFSRLCDRTAARKNRGGESLE